MNGKLLARITFMSLIDEYRRQYAWRDWKRALSLCPILPGQHVLDLGCGVGDISAEFSAHGVCVLGIDENSEFWAAAKVRESVRRSGVGYRIGFGINRSPKSPNWRDRQNLNI